MRTVKLFLCICLMTISVGLYAQDEEQSIEVVRHFVQDFYNWYAPLVLKTDTDIAWERLLKEKPLVLDSNLIHLIGNDYREQAKAKGVIVGIDFDPFLNSQDPSATYVAGKVSGNENVFRVEVRERRSDGGADNAELVAEVSRINGKWRFTNFYYGKNRDLVSILKAQKY